MNEYDFDPEMENIGDYRLQEEKDNDEGNEVRRIKSKISMLNTLNEEEPCNLPVK